MNFIDKIKERARKNKKRIVLPETEDVRTIQAAASIIKEDIADLILVGDKEEILQKAHNYGYNLSKAEIINPATFERMDEYVNTLVELRKKKGMTEEKARKLLPRLRLSAKRT